MGCLSTHVLDTARGKPAAGVKIRLYSCKGEERRLLKSTLTNADGRTDSPLLSADELVTGIYELVFDAGNYHSSQGDQFASPPFLNAVVVRCGVSSPPATYHLPLRLSPDAATSH